MMVIGIGLMVSAVLLFLVGRKVAVQAMKLPTKAAAPA
jgi:hypothetical protein